MNSLHLRGKKSEKKRKLIWRFLKNIPLFIEWPTNKKYLRDETMCALFTCIKNSYLKQWFCEWIIFYYNLLEAI